MTIYTAHEIKIWLLVSYFRSRAYPYNRLRLAHIAFNRAQNHTN